MDPGLSSRITSVRYPHQHFLARVTPVLNPTAIFTHETQVPIRCAREGTDGKRMAARLAKV